MKRRPTSFSDPLDLLSNCCIRIAKILHCFSAYRRMWKRLLSIFPVTALLLRWSLQNRWRDTFYQLRNPTRNIGITRVSLLSRRNYRRLPSLNHDYLRQARAGLVNFLFFFSSIILGKVCIKFEYCNSDMFFDAKSGTTSVELLKYK